tara:strand:+ start:1476 stop:2018 length:543 start_codon:yes stop_codon:yes gene_type:complete
MRLEEVKNTIHKFAQTVIAEAKNNLKSKSTSGNLTNSIRYTFSEQEKGFLISFWGDTYAKYIDKGVRGAKSSYTGDEKPTKPFDRKQPYAYTTKMPPPSKLDKWIVRKGLAPRQKGKFTGRKVSTVGFKKSIQFLIARSIFSKGIKASLFFTKPFEKEFKTLGDQLINDFMVSLNNIDKK